MRFTPTTKAAIQENKLLPQGIWPFTVQTADDTVSKKAKERGETEPNMIALSLKFFNEDGRPVFVKDWIGDWDGGEKLLGIAESLGIGDKYTSGEITSHDLVGLSGYAKVFVKDDATFGKQNQVRVYLPATDDIPYKQERAKVEAERAIPAAKYADATDDGLPF